jgi:RNA polymerase sigma-70 factor (ECF subfamily)
MTASCGNTSIDLARLQPAAPPDPAASGDVFERHLISAAQKGCGESFRALVELHQEATFRVCCQLLNCPDDAREVCQDTFVRAFDSLARYTSQGRWSTWLYRIAVNLCHDRVRARKAQKRPPSVGAFAESTGAGGEGGSPCPRPSPAESLLLSDDLAKLRRGLNLLPVRLREALVLVAVEGLSQRESATILKCSVRALEGRLRRARRELLRWWESER